MASVPLSRILKLSEVIARNTSLLNGYLTTHKLPQPSFAVDAPGDGFVIAKNEPRRAELERARKQLVAATKELHDLSVGPRESVRTQAWDVSFVVRFVVSSRRLFGKAVDCFVHTFSGVT